MGDWAEDARAVAQSQVADPILVVGFLQPAGSWGAFGLSKLNPVAGTLQQRDANRGARGLARAGGFKPKVAMLAITADEVYAFSASPARRGRLDVGELLATWQRDDLVVTTERGRVATRCVLDVVSTGERFELEATMIGGGFNDAFLDEITKPRT